MGRTSFPCLLFLIYWRAQNSEHKRQWRVGNDKRADSEILHEQEIYVILSQDVIHTDFDQIREYNANTNVA
jgi:hypothetical protein